MLYEIPGFQPIIKNNLILLPPGVWDGDTKKRFDLALGVLKCIAYNSGGNSGGISNGAGGSTNSCSINISGNNNNCNNNNIVHEVSGIPSPPSTMTTVTNTTTSTADSLNLSPMTDPDQLSDDDLVLGASASPTETEPMNGSGLVLGQSSPASSPLGTKYGPMTEDNYNKSSPNAVHLDIDRFYSNKSSKKYPLPAMSTSLNGFVGLVNQAMTCYLNSLLQALFMTPEFRNALYRWEFDNDNEAKNIPYQLQKLFLNLQVFYKI